MEKGGIVAQPSEYPLGYSGSLVGGKVNSPVMRASVLDG